MRKKTKKLIAICENCGKKPKPKEENKNFNTYSTTCEYCGGKITLKLEE